MTPSADRAVKILEKMQQTCGSASMAYWVLPNIILTLGGARAYCDGVFWEDDQVSIKHWQSDIERSLEVLKDATTVRASTVNIESTNTKERYVSMELLLSDGLEYVLDQTSLLDKRELHLSDAETIQDLLGEFISNLRKQPRFKDYSDENLHHIAFGIMVGYPDIAISESVLKWAEDDPFMEPLIDADIRGSGYYMCPQPVYSYPRNLVSDSTIKANEKLWSQLLKDYYTSSFHKRLEAEPDFIKKMEELKNFR